MVPHRPLLDHHVHGVVDHDLDRPQFELLMNEGGMPAPAGTSHFDSPVGLAVLSRCGPLLGLDPDCGPEQYVEARTATGVAEVNRRMLRAADLDALLVETGHRPGDVVGPATMGELAGAPAHSIARIERVVEQLAELSTGPRDFCDGVGAALEDAAAGSVGFKTILAYRYGFDLDVRPSDRAEVLRAADGWFAEIASAHRRRLSSPVLLTHVLHAAVDVAAAHGLPIQVHAGFGDTDLTLHRSDPSVFTPWVREIGSRGGQLVFLHCYPYHRQAGCLAAVYPHVSFDVGCMLHYTGPSAGTVLAEAMELAPYTKLLYSSDAFGLPEFVYLGAVLFRRHLDRVLGGWVAAGDCSPSRAEDVRRLVERDNACRLYHLDNHGDTA